MDQDLPHLLNWFGFTEKESTTYRTVLQNGPMTIQEIVDSSGVSRRHVYNIVENLEGYGLLLRNDYINPTTIEPTSPEDVHSLFQEKVYDLYVQIDKSYQQKMGVVDDVKVLKSRSTIVNKIIKMISSAKYRIAISIPIDFLSTVREVLSDAVQRGVAVFVLVYEDSRHRNPAPEFSLEGVSNVIRYRNYELSTLVAIDGISALVSPQHLLTRSVSQTNAVFLGQPYLESVIFTSLMNTEWISGEELFVSSPSELPHTYESFPRAIVDATLYQQRGVSLEAEVSAQSRDTTEPLLKISGEVICINQGFIKPFTSPLPGQTSVILRTEDGRKSVGGKKGYLEDYRAHLTTLRRTD